MERRKFIPRLTAPLKSDRHYYSNENRYFAQGLGMPNCTAYAWGRFYELTGKRYENLKGNAEDFYYQAKVCGLERGTEPRLGAIIVWGEGVVGSGSDGYGHVAVVEEIKPNGDIVTSNSAWQGTEFYLRTVTKASGYTYMSSKPFQGFIYCGIDFYAEEPEKEKVYERVQVGSYLIKANAVRRAKELKSKGYPAIIKKFGLNHRVQVGAYEKHENAVAMRDEMRSIGYTRAYITTEGGTDVSF